MILCAGEALIDMLPRALPDEPAFAPYPGGAVFNTAIALGRLGTPVGFFSALSRDMFGDQLAGALTASKVDTSLALRVDRPCTLAFVQLVDGQARYAFYDENTAGALLAPADVPHTLPRDVTALFVGGISLAQEPCALAYQTLLDRFHGQLVTMIDPNIRPGFIRDEARFRARITAMIAQCDIVKLSDEDLFWLQGDGEIAAKAAEILALGPKFVAITQGADGATGFSAAQTVHVPATRVAVVDTVGAGDTFNAGLLDQLKRDGVLTKSGIKALSADHMRAALAHGIACAGVTVSRAGANPPWAHEIAAPT